jgi:diguanylate cyclase (GGDEF)-like protein/PAS domain S-box-containing protein
LAEDLDPTVMSAVRWNDDSASTAAVTASLRDVERARVVLARKWAYLISTTAYIPVPRVDLERELLVLVDRLFATMHSEPFDWDSAVDVGYRLVDLQCVGPESIRRTVEVLGRALAQEPGPNPQRAERTALVLGAMMSGYSDALRQFTRRKQEDLHQALSRTALEFRRNHLDAAAQLDELLANSVHGIAVLEPDGTFVRVNTSLAGTLEQSVDELTGHTLFDVVHPADLSVFRLAFADLLARAAGRLRHSCRLVRKDGETVWVSFVGSLVSDFDGSVRRVVMVITDDTELSLLQSRLSHQSLHDSLTGLPNRQFFGTRLENALRRAHPATGITLYYLDLDGFSLVANGYGAEMAERLLKVVAERLRTVVAEENAIVARLGGDEFAVLVENTPTTPDVVTVVESLNNELSEPAYLDGRHGLAASATIGVVHRPHSGAEPAELLRAAEMTMRRARSYSRGQWQLFDADEDGKDRQRFRLAASMPGAWETGEVGVAYRPAVRLADETVTGVEAVLRWDHPEQGHIPHEDCVDLADRTGLSLPMGRWLLRSACEEIQRREQAGRAPILSVELTAGQAADPDLVGGVRRVLEATGLSPRRLRIGLPAQALLTGSADLMDNVRVLTDLEVGWVLHEFGTVGDLACWEGPAPRAVRIARRLVDRQAAGADTDPLVKRAITHLVDLAQSAGAEVIVDGIGTTEQLDWWRQAGADIGMGALFAAALDDPPAS